MNRIFLNCQFNELEESSELISVTLLFERTKTIKHFVFMDKMSTMIIKNGLVKNISVMNSAKTEISTAISLIKNNEYAIDVIYDTTDDNRLAIIKSIEKYVDACAKDDSYQQPKVIMDVSAYGWVKFISMMYKNATYNTKLNYIPTDLSTMFELAGDEDADRIAYYLFKELCSNSIMANPSVVSSLEKREKLPVGIYGALTGLKYNGILSTVIMQENYTNLLKLLKLNNK